jgi:hypothetical protein
LSCQIKALDPGGRLLEAQATRNMVIEVLPAAPMLQVPEAEELDLNSNGCFTRTAMLKSVTCRSLIIF